MIDNRPETVVHLAGTVGGIGLNQAEPGRLTYENLQMGLNIIEESRLHNVSKFVCVGTICSMAHSCPAPFQEEDFIQFNRSGPGMPEITNAGYGLAKRMLYEMLLNYRRQYGMKFAYLLPTNQVGPGDHFEEHKSHVVPALIKRIYEAKELDSPYVQVWGDGTATRDFLDIRDTAKAIAKTVESYEGEAPINLGSGCELSIKEVVGVICKVVGYQGGIIWDASKPNGQPRRVADAIAEALDGPDCIYLSLDIDVIDPGMAPGTGTPEPGGMLTREVLRAIRQIVGAVEIAGMGRRA
jgi:GDP-L-fucose synthase